MAGNPWDKFFWSDYQSDTSLRACSLAAQGLWMRMLCIMAEAEPRGHLLIGIRQATERDLARAVGEDIGTVKELLAELEGNGVFSRLGRSQTIINRRMVKASKISKERAKAGRKSWEHRENGPPTEPNGINGFDVLHEQNGSKGTANRSAKIEPQYQKPVPEARIQESESKIDSYPSISDSVLAREPAPAPEPELDPEFNLFAGIEPAPPDPPPEPIASFPEPEIEDHPIEMDRAKMPRLNDPPCKWIGTVTAQSGKDASGVTRPVFGSYFVDELSRQVCEAAGMDRPNWRGDWWTITSWVSSDFREPHILAAIKARRERFGKKWNPPDTLAGLDRFVREYNPRKAA